MIKKDILGEKTYNFAISVVLLCKDVMRKNREFILTKQCIRSSTSIGANISEAAQAESRKDFIYKLSVSIKEGYETRYWICLLRDTNELQSDQANGILKELDEILALLGASIRTAKKNLIKNN